MRADGTLRRPVIIWAVRVGDDVYVRSVNGTPASWYRGTRDRHEGWISSGGVEQDVAFEDVGASEAVQDRIDAAYRTKYGAGSSAVASITAPIARAATPKVYPALSGRVGRPKSRRRPTLSARHRVASCADRYCSSVTGSSHRAGSLPSSSTSRSA